LKIFKKVLNGAINLVFYPVLAIVLAVVILFACGIKPYITMSGSMEPNIHTGSVCFVNTRADYNEIEQGDVIAYKTPAGGLVTHRVISVTEDGLETKGDNNDVTDGISTTTENFHGETLFSVPYVGYALKTLQNPRNFMIIGIIIALFFAYGLLDSYFEKQEEKEKLKKEANETEKDNVKEDFENKPIEDQVTT
jgi:signal peptidase